MAPAHGPGGEAKTVKIYVNGRSVDWPKDLIFFEDLVKIFLNGAPQPANARYTIVYSKGHSEKAKGKLNPGESVKVKEGMEFDVDQTIES